MPQLVKLAIKTVVKEQLELSLKRRKVSIS